MSGCTCLRDDIARPGSLSVAARRRRRASGMPAHVDATCNERARHSKTERLKRSIGPIRRQSPIWSIPDEGARQNARAERDERVTAHADHANTADGRKEDARWPRARRPIASCRPSRRARNDEGLVRGQTVRSARVARIRPPECVPHSNSNREGVEGFTAVARSRPNILESLDTAKCEDGGNVSGHGMCI